MLYFNILVAVALEVGLKTNLLKPTHSMLHHSTTASFNILGLDVVEFIFFSAVCIVLCFGFVTTTVLTVHQCISYC